MYICDRKFTVLLSALVSGSETVSESSFAWGRYRVRLSQKLDTLLAITVLCRYYQIRQKISRKFESNKIKDKTILSEKVEQKLKYISYVLKIKVIICFRARAGFKMRQGTKLKSL